MNKEKNNRLPELYTIVRRISLLLVFFVHQWFMSQAQINVSCPNRICELQISEYLREIDFVDSLSRMGIVTSVVPIDDTLSLNIEYHNGFKNRTRLILRGETLINESIFDTNGIVQFLWYDERGLLSTYFQRMGNGCFSVESLPNES